jgi:DNA primase large subunit
MQSVRRRDGSNKVDGPAALSHRTDNLGLSFYEVPPHVDISIREFEETALERLKLLHSFERLCGHDGRADEKSAQMLNELHHARLRLRPPDAQFAEAFPQERERFIKRDATSHFALRLAFCKTREAREWFIRQEHRLFIVRFDQLHPEAQHRFLSDAGVGGKKFEPGKDEPGKNKMTIEFLSATTSAAKIWTDGRFVTDPTFYEMPFHEVHPSLVAGRKVVVKDGIAYVPSCALKLMIAAKFKERLSASLEAAQQGLPMALADPRVGGFLKLLQEQGMQLLVAPKSCGEDVGERLSMDNFEALLVRSFPPCMRRLVEAQRDQKKHLKHAGRLQLRPFLKDCGFNFEESICWWKKELCRDREIDATTFEKNYTYDVEHTYGKKGHFQGANSFACPKLINFPGEGTGQVHGCPFKQLDVQPLKNLLHKWRIPENSTNEIEKLIKGGNHYQLSCIEYFKAMHPGHEGDGVGNSPGDYFQESCLCYKPKSSQITSVAAPS